MQAAVQSKAKRNWWRRGAVLTIALLLLYWLLPVMLTWLASCLIRNDPLQPADIVIALGGGKPCVRLQYAAELYRRGLARKVLVTGIVAPPGSLAEEAARQQLVNLGIPPAEILVLKNTRNTRTEGEAIGRLMHEQGWQSALIVTDPSHTRRARYSLQRAAPDLTFYAAPLPAAPGVWRAERWWSRRGDMYHTIREFLAWANTLIGGLS